MVSIDSQFFPREGAIRKLVEERRVNMRDVALTAVLPWWRTATHPSDARIAFHIDFPEQHGFRPRKSCSGLSGLEAFESHQDTNLLELPFETCQDFQDDFRSPPARAATTNAAGFDFSTPTTEVLSQ